MVSLLIGTMPVWLKGPRHIFSFLLSFVMMQMWHNDGLYRWLASNIVAEVCSVPSLNYSF